MGYIRHHTIIVTSYDSDKLHAAHHQAERIFGEDMVSNIVDSPVNGYKSFFVAPDGSKEGWEDSDNYDKDRGEFIRLIKLKDFEDGSNAIQYIEVAYDEEGVAKIERNN